MDSGLALNASRSRLVMGPCMAGLRAVWWWWWVLLSSRSSSPSLLLLLLSLTGISVTTLYRPLLSLVLLFTPFFRVLPCWVCLLVHSGFPLSSQWIFTVLSIDLPLCSTLWLSCHCVSMQLSSSLSHCFYTPRFQPPLPHPTWCCSPVPLFPVDTEASTQAGAP